MTNKALYIAALVSLSLLCGCRYDKSARNGSNYYGTWRYTGFNSMAIYGYTGNKIGEVKMAKNTKFCRPTEDGKALEYAPVIIPPKTSAPTEYEYNQAGWYRNAVQPPEIPEGKVVATVTYVYDELDNEVVAEYTYEDAPKPVRTFSKLKLYGALTQAGIWDAFEAWLKTKTINGMSAYTAFSLAQDLNDENPLFLSVVEEAKTALGVSDEFVEAILEASILEM